MQDKQNVMGGQTIDSQNAQRLGEWAIKTVQQNIKPSSVGASSGGQQQVEQLGKQLYQAVRAFETTGTFSNTESPTGSP